MTNNDTPDDSLTDSGAMEAGWHPDPLRRAELRYHDGKEWTDQISTKGKRLGRGAGMIEGAAGGGVNIFYKSGYSG